MEFYYHSVDKDVLVLSADGGLDSHNAEEFVNELGGLVEGERGSSSSIAHGSAISRATVLRSS